MSCNCGCDDKARPVTGWRRFVPFLIVAALLAALIAGAIAKRRTPSNANARVTADQEVGP
ncbi:MAG: hypothetical protein ACK4WH_01645 [Phycisphaerales bacterium]